MLKFNINIFDMSSLHYQFYSFDISETLRSSDISFIDILYCLNNLVFKFFHLSYSDSVWFNWKMKYDQKDKKYSVIIVTASFFSAAGKIHSMARSGRNCIPRNKDIYERIWNASQLLLQWEFMPNSFSR